MSSEPATLISEQAFDLAWKARARADGELLSYREAIDFPIHRVWTIYENGRIDEHGYDDATWFATPGLVPAFALGYVVTEREWTVATPDAVWHLDDDGETREERRRLNLEQAIF